MIAQTGTSVSHTRVHAIANTKHTTARALAIPVRARPSRARTEHGPVPPVRHYTPHSAFSGRAGEGNAPGA
jgi:hypothetical protein